MITQENQDPIIELRNLKKYFKVKKSQLHAVDDISVKIYKGKTLGVVGESGCGKSTLGRSIIKLTEPTSGEIYFKGTDISKYSRKDMKKICTNMQIIFQDPYASLNPRLTVSDIIAEPMIVNKIFDNKKELYERVNFLMETVGLTKRLFNAYPHELDGGRRQRIGIARALSLNPEFLVCDEPVSALDVSIQAQILNLLMDLQDKMGLTYMFITHDLSVVKHISDEIMVMYLGQCVEKANSKELFRNPKHPYTKALLAAIPIPDISMRDKPNEVIHGEITSPIDPKPGCRFAPRCKYKSDICTKNEIELREITSGHFVACPFAK